jgi:hypothetical protein
MNQSDHPDHSLQREVPLHRQIDTVAGRLREAAIAGFVGARRAKPETKHHEPKAEEQRQDYRQDPRRAPVRLWLSPASTHLRRMLAPARQRKLSGCDAYGRLN